MKKGQRLRVTPIPLNTEQVGEGIHEPRTNPKLVKLLEEFGWIRVKRGYRVPKDFMAIVAYVSGKLTFIHVTHIPSNRRFLEISLLGNPDRDYTQIFWKE